MSDLYKMFSKFEGEDGLSPKEEIYAKNKYYSEKSYEELQAKNFEVQ